MCDKKDAGMDWAERAVPESVGGPVPSPPGGRTWEELMRMAIGLAAGAEARGEVPVGAVIADRSGSVVGEGGNAPLGTCDPTAHAEIMAIRSACRRLGNYRLEGCVMVVTMEPCAMCAGAIVHARLDGVVYGCRDALAGSSGRFLPEPPGMAYGRSAERGMRRSYPYLFCKTPLKHVKREKSPNT